MHQTKSYELNKEEKVPIMKNWIGRESLQLIKTHNYGTKKSKWQDGYFSH